MTEIHRVSLPSDSISVSKRVSKSKCASHILHSQFSNSHLILSFSLTSHVARERGELPSPAAIAIHIISYFIYKLQNTNETAEQHTAQSTEYIFDIIERSHFATKIHPRGTIRPFLYLKVFYIPICVHYTSPPQNCKFVTPPISVPNSNYFELETRIFRVFFSFLFLYWPWNPRKRAQAALLAFTRSARREKQHGGRGG